MTLSASYMRQDDGYLSVAWGGMMVICQLHDAGLRLSVSYMRKDDGSPLVTRGMLSVSYMSRDDGYLSVT